MPDMPGPTDITSHEDEQAREFAATARAVFELGLSGIALATREIKQAEEVRVYVEEILARSMPPQDKKFARMLYEGQVRLLADLSIKLQALPDRVLDVYGRFSEVFKLTSEAREFLSGQLAARNPAVRTPAARAMLPIATPVIMLTSAVLRREGLVQPCLAGFAAFPLYPVAEAYQKMLLAFAGKPQMDFELGRRVRETTEFLASDGAKTLTNVIAPRLLFLVDLVRKFMTSRIDVEVKKFTSATEPMDKLIQLSATARLLQDAVGSAELIVQRCLAGLDGSADMLNQQLASASEVLSQMG